MPKWIVSNLSINITLFSCTLEGHIRKVSDIHLILLFDQEDVFYQWINPAYLDPVTQSEIQERFEEESEIELTDFLLVCQIDL